MGWANCGEDSTGRPIGYAHEALCDHPECVKHIDRGLAYACGGEHGAGEGMCEGYFCYEHREVSPLPAEDMNDDVCARCAIDSETDVDTLVLRLFAVHDRPMERDGTWSHVDEYAWIEARLRELVGAPPKPEDK